MNRRLQHPDISVSDERGSMREPSVDTRTRKRRRPIEFQPMPKGQRTVNKTEGVKRCPKCKQAKPLKEFGNNARRYDGLQATCMPCLNAHKRERRAAYVAFREPTAWSRLSDHERADWLRERARSV